MSDIDELADADTRVLRAQSLELYERNGVLLRERDIAIALREDAETKCAVLEANLAGYVARLREEKVAAESAVRTVSMRVEEVQRERDAALASVEAMRVERDDHPAITAEDAAHWECGCVHPDCIAAGQRVDAAIKAHAERHAREHGKAGG